MDGFRLFDAEHRSSRPLCLAYKAAQLADPDKADAFLTALRYSGTAESSAAEVSFKEFLIVLSHSSSVRIPPGSRLAIILGSTSFMVGAFSTD